MDEFIGAVKELQIDTYLAGEVDVVYLAYTQFVNTMKQKSLWWRNWLFVKKHLGANRC